MSGDDLPVTWGQVKGVFIFLIVAVIIIAWGAASTLMESGESRVIVFFGVPIVAFSALSGWWRP